MYTVVVTLFFFFSSRRRHTRYIGDWSSDVCSSGLLPVSLPCRHRWRCPWPRPCGCDCRSRRPRRSEERRVGKECRSGWGRYHGKKKRRNRGKGIGIEEEGENDDWTLSSS